MKNWRSIVAQVVMVALCAAILWMTVVNGQECEQAGGAYVRGMWGMVCVGRK